MRADPRPLKVVIPSAPWTRAIELGEVTLPGYTIQCGQDPGNAPDRFIATKSEDLRTHSDGARAGGGWGSAEPSVLASDAA